MSNLKRLHALLLLLAALLIIRWIDPFKWLKSGVEIAQPVNRLMSAPPLATEAHSNQEHHIDSRQVLKWPLRNNDDYQTKHDAFVGRTEYSATLSKVQQYVPPRQSVYVPPPVVESPPTESAPELKILGTWGTDPDVSVFVETPQGTQQVAKGSTVLGYYEVKVASRQNLVLENMKTRKNWTFAIPDAPTQLSSWPGR